MKTSKNGQIYQGEPTNKADCILTIDDSNLKDLMLGTLPAPQVGGVCVIVKPCYTNHLSIHHIMSLAPHP